MAADDIRSLSGGINQTGVRAHNERLLLSMIQRFGPMPGSDLARHSGLSSQTVSVILRRLENDGLLERGAPQRGRVGKPSVPMGLAPDGVLTIGLKIGRRTADLVLVDLVGKVRRQSQITYPYPVPERVFGFLREGLEQIAAEIDNHLVRRIAGIGVAVPFELWNWSETIDAPSAEVDRWREIDFYREIAAFSDLPVLIENDATAACRAEHFFREGSEFRDYAYFYVASFFGGGVVINNSVFEGSHFNAGAFGSLPVSASDGTERQLLDVASIYLLERALREAGDDPEKLWVEPQDWSGFETALAPWIGNTAAHLARAAQAVCSVIDFEAVVIDGAFPAAIRDRLVAETRRLLPERDHRGLIVPRIEAGCVGAKARALGAACGPLFAKYLLNTHAGLSPA